MSYTPCVVCTASALPLNYDNQTTTSSHNDTYWRWLLGVRLMTRTGWLLGVRLKHSVPTVQYELAAQVRRPGFQSQKCLIFICLYFFNIKMSLWFDVPESPLTDLHLFSLEPLHLLCKLDDGILGVCCACWAWRDIIIIRRLPQAIDLGRHNSVGKRTLRTCTHLTWQCTPIKQYTQTSDCMNNQWTTSPWRKAGLDVMQSVPLCRICFGHNNRLHKLC